MELRAFTPENIVNLCFDYGITWHVELVIRNGVFLPAEIHHSALR